MASTTRGYVPLVGYVTASQREKAIREFQRRVHCGQQDVEVLIATRVSLQKWLHSTVDCFTCVFIEARYVGDKADPTTTVDLFVTKVRETAQDRAVAEIIGQIGNYACETGRKLIPGGWNMDFVFPGTLRHVVRRPDAALRPICSSTADTPVEPRLMVQVEFRHRCVSTAERLCRENFELIPQLRVVLLVMFFGRHSDGSFACLAMLFRRELDEVIAADVVSFGSAPLDETTLTYLQRDDTPPVRCLPLMPVLLPNQVQLRPWATEDNAFVRIPATDVFAGALERDTKQPLHQPPGGFPDIVIDLWEIANLMDNLPF